MNEFESKAHKLTYTFRSDNAGLYWVCKSQKKRDKVMKIINHWVYNWWVILFMIVVVVILSSLWQYSDSVFDLETIDGQKGSDAFFGFATFALLVANMWSLLLMLSLNRRAFVMLLSMFVYSHSVKTYIYIVDWNDSRNI